MERVFIYKEGWKRAIVVEKQDSGCWTTPSTKEKYPKVTINGNRVLLSRLLYEAQVDKVPKELSMLHKCDNIYCVNPDHVYPGTYYDNNWDRENRHRLDNRNYNRSKYYSEKEMIMLRDPLL